MRRWRHLNDLKADADAQETAKRSVVASAGTGGDLPDCVKTEGGRETEMVIPFRISKPIKSISSTWIMKLHKISAWTDGFKELFEVRPLYRTIREREKSRNQPPTAEGGLVSQRLVWCRKGWFVIAEGGLTSQRVV